MLLGECIGVGIATRARASSPASSPDRKRGSPSNRVQIGNKRASARVVFHKVLKVVLHHNVQWGVKK
jgi:hypothetical protein